MNRALRLSSHFADILALHHRWLISLVMFSIAVTYILSDTTGATIKYDVPALAVGLLFALPFMRR